MSKQPAQKELLKYLLLPIAVVILLLLTSINIQNYLNSNSNNREVLGQTISVEEEISFWKNLLEENPDYIPGWEALAAIYKENGDEDKLQSVLETIKGVDPNYKTSLGN